ncbi:MAG: hypothetical protein ACRDTD_20205, partial [Pseudonocardiaceae bacterium]
GTYTATLLFGTGLHSCGGLAVHGADLYVSDTKANAVLRAPLDGSGDLVPFARGLDRPGPIATQGKHLYIKESRRISRIPLHTTWSYKRS